jgi:hypothetical protein
MQFPRLWWCGQQGADLQRILAYRFGPINQTTLAHLNIATKEQIEYWIERTLDAKSLDDVFVKH